MRSSLSDFKKLTMDLSSCAMDCPCLILWYAHTRTHGNTCIHTYIDISVTSSQRTNIAASVLRFYCIYNLMKWPTYGCCFQSAISLSHFSPCLYLSSFSLSFCHFIFVSLSLSFYLPFLFISVSLHLSLSLSFSLSLSLTQADSERSMPIGYTGGIWCKSVVMVTHVLWPLQAS